MCNCQDYPDKYWEKITLSDLKIDNAQANFSWTWGNGFKYNVETVKQNGQWKISYLEGFDVDEFLPAP